MSQNKQKRLKIPAASFGKETDRAYGFNLDNRIVYLPKSQLADYERGADNISFWCPAWLIAEKQLDFYLDTSHEPTLF